MSHITTESRAEFSATSKKIKELIQECLKKEKEYLATMTSDNSGTEYKKILLAEQMLYISTLYISINTQSLAILGTKNNDALNDARKMIYKSVIYLEEVVSSFVDCPFSDLDKYLEKITNVPIEKRLYLVRKIGLVIQLLSDALGDNSKWKWSFIELRGRYTAVAKNFIDMKQACKDYFDPSSPDYENSVLYIRLVRKLLDRTSEEYRSKYELSTRRIDDMKSGINFLIANRRVAMALGDNDESEEIRKKAIAWKAKMEADQKAGSSN